LLAPVEAQAREGSAVGGEERALLVRMLGALLFASDHTMGEGEICRALGIGRGELAALMAELDRHLSPLGLMRERVGGGWRLATAPDLGEFLLARLGERESLRLSPAALEVLAIVAYRQPITRPEIDHLRQTGSESPLKTLLKKGLIATRGRAEQPGRPFRYVTTRRFLELFGLDRITDLPRLSADAKQVEESLFPGEAESRRGEGEGDEGGGEG